MLHKHLFFFKINMENVYIAIQRYIIFILSIHFKTDLCLISSPRFLPYAKLKKTKTESFAIKKSTAEISIIYLKFLIIKITQ